MEIKSIQSSTLQEIVYGEILQAIVSGAIPPGEKITLDRLAKKMNVSIMPVREAIRKLEAGNFVSIQKNRRIVVKKLSAENVNEILEIRLILECLAAKKASKICSEESLKQLETIHYKIAHSRNEESYLRLHREFHRVIYKEAKMPILLEIIDVLWERISPYVLMVLREDKLRTANIFLKNHAGILEGMKRRNTGKVCKWLKNDLIDAAQIYSKILKQEKNRKLDNDNKD